MCARTRASVCVLSQDMDGENALQVEGTENTNMKEVRVLGGLKKANVPAM